MDAGVQWRGGGTGRFRRPWRIVVRPNLTMLTLLAGLVATAGAWRHMDDQRRQDRLVDATCIARQRIHSEIRLRSALANATLSDEGWVTEVDPSWFGPPPCNPMLAEQGRPWIEVARDADESVVEPTPIEAGPGTAQWWYNPSNGCVCARVPAQSTRERTLALHDAVNH
jgi:hypothetical protein